jgi:Gluconate 2-dehydrogenase subunit 3
MHVVNLGELYVLNNCSKFLSRVFAEPRHNYQGQFDDGDFRAHIADSWRFPIVDAWSDGTHFVDDYAYNSVTFIYPIFPNQTAPQVVSVIGTFSDLFEPIALEPVAGEPVLALTVILPKGRVYTYQYMVDGNPTLDPINPQRVALDNGKTWSQFFTDQCLFPVTLEDWEWTLLDRMTQAILPFNTEAGRRFLSGYRSTLNAGDVTVKYAPALFRLDEPVGVVNFIDKLLAKQENHRLKDYRACLPQIDKAVRAADPDHEPADMPDEVYDRLYAQMAAAKVPGWDTCAYAHPASFLKLLRRHAYEGAFSHPKYGGNIGAAGWAYLESRFNDTASGTTLFDWERITEPPLGKSVDYRG